MVEDRKLKPEDWPCPESDDHHTLPGAVLLSDEIEYYATKYKMVFPFDRNYLKPAGIYLCLGPLYSLGGKRQELENKPGKDELIIPPFQVAIIETLETINLPRFIIARWNLRVSNVYKGLLWTGALQVDPGWLGQLPCPIYNLSNEDVTLRLGEKIVLMDFVKTTAFGSHSQLYKNRPGIDRLGQSYKLKSALFSEAAERIDKIEKVIDEKVSGIKTQLTEELGRSEKRINKVEAFVGLVIAAIGILFAALSIFVTSGALRTGTPQTPYPWFILWPLVSIIIAISALLISLWRPDLPTRRRKIWITLFLVLYSLLLAYLGYPSSKDLISSFLGMQ